MLGEHVPYFDITKIHDRICLHKCHPDTSTLERIHAALRDVQNEIDACLYDFAQYGGDIEIGHDVHESKKSYLEVNAFITKLQGLEQQLRDIVAPPIEYIAFAEYKNAFWAQRRLTQGCKSPRADDRTVSKPRRFAVTNQHAFLATLRREGRSQPTYRVELLSSHNPIRVALIN